MYIARPGARACWGLVGWGPPNRELCVWEPCAVPTFSIAREEVPMPRQTTTAKHMLMETPVSCLILFPFSCFESLTPGGSKTAVMSLRGAQRRSNLNPWDGRLPRFARNDIYG